MTRPAEKKTVRCAVYTRKSTDENLSLEFNSLDAQRESAEAYIASMKHEGWVCLSERYDDGGFSGGNMERPALRRLIADIASGGVDCVVIYKIDRLSRSLLDFNRIMQMLEDRGVSLVAVTQQINTTTSSGRLMLNILSSFAQFEREIISERTRDKIAAARRKGKWSGGHPLLGYDIERSIRGSRIVVNEEEAEQVRAIFRLYVSQGSLLKTCDELRIRGWVTKRWETKAGKPQGGEPFTKVRLLKMLTNVLYRGQVRYRDEVHVGEHEAIVPPVLWQQVQDRLATNRLAGGADVRNKYNALLKGLIRCTACDAPMGHTYSSRGDVRYRYYLCRGAEKNGRKTCPSRSVPAQEFERFIVEQVKGLGSDPALAAKVITQAERRRDDQMKGLVEERKALRRSAAIDRQRLSRTSDADKQEGIRERLLVTQRRLKAIDAELDELKAGAIDRKAAKVALSNFQPVWDQLTPLEQRTLLGRLIERIDYDGATKSVRIAFRPDIPVTWFHEVATKQMEDVA